MMELKNAIEIAIKALNAFYKANHKEAIANFKRMQESGIKIEFDIQAMSEKGPYNAKEHLQLENIHEWELGYIFALEDKRFLETKDIKYALEAADPIFVSNSGQVCFMKEYRGLQNMIEAIDKNISNIVEVCNPIN